MNRESKFLWVGSNCMFWLRVWPQISFRWRNPQLIQCKSVLAKMASKAVNRFKKGAQMWQTTDHTTEKMLATDRFVCTRATSPPPKKNSRNLLSNAFSSMLCLVAAWPFLVTNFGPGVGRKNILTPTAPPEFTSFCCLVSNGRRRKSCRVFLLITRRNGRVC